MPSNLQIARHLFRNKSNIFALSRQSNLFRERNPPTSGEAFNVQKHIEKPVVRLNPSKKYFTLTDVAYEQTTAKPKKEKTEPTPKPNESGGSSGDNGL